MLWPNQPPFPSAAQLAPAPRAAQLPAPALARVSQLASRPKPPQRLTLVRPYPSRTAAAATAPNREATSCALGVRAHPVIRAACPVLDMDAEDGRSIPNPRRRPYKSREQRLPSPRTLPSRRRLLPQRSRSPPPAPASPLRESPRSLYATDPAPSVMMTPKPLRRAKAERHVLDAPLLRVPRSTRAPRHRPRPRCHPRPATSKPLPRRRAVPRAATTTLSSSTTPSSNNVGRDPDGAPRRAPCFRTRAPPLCVEPSAPSFAHRPRPDHARRTATQH
jgi:hypothetical protein